MSSSAVQRSKVSHSRRLCWGHILSAGFRTPMHNLYRYSQDSKRRGPYYPSRSLEPVRILPTMAEPPSIPYDGPAPDLLARIALCTELGKDCRDAPYPPEMAGEDGVDELVREALGSGVDPNDVLAKGLMVGMDRIGILFGEKRAFVPQLLLSARAMTRGMGHLKPYFQSGEAIRKGKLVLGVVAGDLHDIGKNLVRMMVEGAGWEVIDLSIDTPPERFTKAVEDNPGCYVGLGTLLTSTMVHMEGTIQAIKRHNPEIVVVVGGAPINQTYVEAVGADLCLQNAHAAREYFAAIK